MNASWLTIFESIVCVLGGVACLYFAYWLIRKNRPTTQIVSLVIIGLLLFILRPSGVTLFLKSIALSAINAVGQRVTDLETQIVSTREDLKKQTDAFKADIQGLQKTNASHQAEISKQLVSIQLMQTNLNTQQAKLETVEYWVDNYFANMVTETVSGADTNRLILCYKTNDMTRLLLLLEHVPIEKSLQVEISGAGVYPQKLKFMRIGNVIGGTIVHFPDINSLKFEVSYVRDTRETNRIRQVVLEGKKILFDNYPVDFLEGFRQP